MLTYPYTLTRDSNDTWLVRFRDIPEALTVGQDVDEAAINAEEALELRWRSTSRRAAPFPCPPSLPRVRRQ